MREFGVQSAGQSGLRRGDLLEVPGLPFDEIYNGRCLPRGAAVDAGGGFVLIEGAAALRILRALHPRGESEVPRSR